MNAYEVLGWFMIGLSITLFGAYLGMNLERKRWRKWLRDPSTIGHHVYRYNEIFRDGEGNR